jgi:hypothetical protein
MKSIKNIMLGSVLLGMTALSSCLKDTVIPPSDPLGGSPSVVGFLGTGDAAYALNGSVLYGQYTFSFAPFADTTGININVAYLGQGTPSQDIVVNLGVDAAALTAYNTNTGAGFVLPPTEVYSLPASVTIPKGKYNATARLVIKNVPQFDFSKKYALPVAITSATGSIGVSSNMGKAIYAFGIKNKYDGKYSVTEGFVQRYTNPTTPETGGNLNGSVAGNADVSLATVGANEVEITGLQWAKGSNSGVAGIDNLRATIDPTTNLVTMRSLGNTSLANWTGKVNKYDPATKTFTLNFDWNQTTSKREYSVVLKYKGSR